MLRGIRLALMILGCCLPLLVGCPKPTPPVVAPPAEETSGPVLPADDAEAVKAAESLGAKLIKSGDGRVVEVSQEDANDDLLAAVAKLPGVTRLIARGPNVTDAGLAHLKGHPSLRILDLKQTGFHNEALENLVGVPLEEIALELTNVTDPGVEILSRIKSLRRLKLIKTKVTNEGLVHVKNLPNLEVLDLQDVVTVNNDCLPDVKQCSKLRFLRIYGQGFREQGIAPIGEMKNLRALSMEQTILKDDNIGLLKDLTSLEKLSIFGTFVTDKGMEQLSGLKNLKELEVRDTTIGAGGSPMEFLKNHPNITHLDLSETGTRNEALANIAQLKNLEKLYLWHTQIDDEGVKALEGMTSLTYLNLDDVRIGNAAMESVGKLTNLTFLHIGKTDVSDEGLEHLHSLKKLQTIHLSNLVNVSDDAIASLQEAIPALKKEGAIIR